MLTGEPIDTQSSEQTQSTSLWRNRDYLLLLCGQAVSRSGTQISQTATPLLVLAITGSAAWAGILFGMVLVPHLLLSLPAGALIDRWDRKRVMILCDILRACALGSIPLALVFGKLTLIQLCVTSLIEGTCAVFFSVAETASFPQVIDEKQTRVAVGQQQAANNLSILLGPALAGVTLSIGRIVPFALDALSYVVSVVSLLFIQRPLQEERAETTSTTILEEIREGLRWLWQDKLIRLFTVLAALGSGIDNALVLVFLVIATQRLHTPPYAIGIAIGVSAGGGGIVGALLAARLERTFGVSKLTITTSWIRVVLLPLLLLAPNIVVLGIVMFFDGLALVAQGTALYATRQVLIPEHIRGRISSVYALVTLGSPLLFIWGAGASLQWFGTTTTILLLVAIAILAALLVSWSSDIRTLSKRAPGEAEGTKSEELDMTRLSHPRHALELARQHKLGEYLTCYGSERSASVVGVVAIGIGILVVCASAVFMPLLLTLLLAWQVALLPLIALGWMSAGCWVLWPSLLAQKKMVELYEEGMICRSRKGNEVFRWHDIETLWRKTGDGKHTPRCEVQRKDGYVFAFDSTLLSAKRLERILEREVIHQLFAYYVDRYRQNISLPFGPIVIRQQGISVEPHTHLVPWNQLKYIHCFDDMISIRLKHQCDDIASIAVASVPNACVLKAVIRHIHRVHREAFIRQRMIVPRRPPLRPQASPVWQ